MTEKEKKGKKGGHKDEQEERKYNWSEGSFFTSSPFLFRAPKGISPCFPYSFLRTVAAKDQNDTVKLL